MKTVKLGFFGCGNVGSGVYRLLTSFAGEIEHRCGVRFEVQRILVRSLAKKRDVVAPAGVFTTDYMQIVNDPQIDIILEFLGGEEPAHTYLEAALNAGKTVVTANKVALALHWPELQQAAEAHNAGLYFEAAVCGAIPILHSIEDSLQANSISSVYGIVNGTTNYILTRMSHEGAEYADVLKDAQALGLAEPDPSSDVEGLDAAYKLSILASLAFHGRVPFQNVYVEGITKVSADDISSGKDLGYTLKLLAIAKRSGLKVETRVHPTFIRNDHPLAGISGSFNAVFLHGHACGDMMFMGRGAGDYPTASAVVSDLIRAATAEKPAYPSFDNAPDHPIIFENNTDWVCSYYVRIYAVDKPGVLSKIAQTFADYNVSIDAMQQKNVSTDGHATLIFITHEASERNMQAALSQIPAEIGVVKSILRVEK